VTTTVGAPPTPGAQAPDFALPTQRGVRRSLSEYLAQGPVLLAFHRGTW
jgi:peroxiredoxin